MTLKKLQAVGLGCLVSASATAGIMGDEYWDGDSAWVITASAGPAWMKAGETQTIYLQSDVFKTYTADRDKETIAAAELFFGMQRVLNSKLQGQLGLAFAGTTSSSLDGDVYEDGNSFYNDFAYSYKVQHMHVALKGKLLLNLDFDYEIVPYISGSLGYGRNKASSFSITPRIQQAVPAPSFQTTSTNSFSYTLGAGIQMPFAPNWWAGIGYEWMGWGKSELGRAPGQTMGTGPSINNITSSQFQLSLTYLC
ncbi:outer membrane protein [Legionella donaldsonii]|uniref:outer membrane protein n=1 Tax=Legionella donaldsonii TaxID=45060 RepID=UPI00399CD180